MIGVFLFTEREVWRGFRGEFSISLTSRGRVFISSRFWPCSHGHRRQPQLQVLRPCLTKSKREKGGSPRGVSPTPPSFDQRGRPSQRPLSTARLALPSAAEGACDVSLWHFRSLSWEEGGGEGNGVQTVRQQRLPWGHAS